jgi:hypothetical protein
MVYAPPGGDTFTPYNKVFAALYDMGRALEPLVIVFGFTQEQFFIQAYKLQSFQTPVTIMERQYPIPVLVLKYFQRSNLFFLCVRVVFDWFGLLKEKLRQGFFVGSFFLEIIAFDSAPVTHVNPGLTIYA